LERSSSGSKISLNKMDRKKVHLYELLVQYFAHFLWIQQRGYDSHGQDINLGDTVIIICSRRAAIWPHYFLFFGLWQLGVPVLRRKVGKSMSICSSWSKPNGDRTFKSFTSNKIHSEYVWPGLSQRTQGFTCMVHWICHFLHAQPLIQARILQTGKNTVGRSGRVVCPFSLN
jgi:hypothetical protein